MGAWIEIIPGVIDFPDVIVAPLVGAWIEINFGIQGKLISASLLSWERGLKS